MKSMAEMMLGEMTGCEGIPSVESGAPMLVTPKQSSKPAPSKDAKRKRDRFGRVVKEDRDGSVIPADAEDLNTTSALNGVYIKPPVEAAQKPASPINNATVNTDLITPLAALTAPDVTPEGLATIDFSKIPGFNRGGTPGSVAKPALDTVLGKTTPAVATTPIVSEAAMIASLGLSSVTDDGNPIVSAGTGAALLKEGQVMPPPADKGASTATLIANTRKFFAS